MLLFRVELHLIDALNRLPDSVTYVKARSLEHALAEAALLPGDWVAAVIRR